MTDQDLDRNRYEDYAQRFDPEWVEGAGSRRNRTRHAPKKARDQILAELTDELTDVELRFDTSYQPSRYEEGWLLSSLYTFYDQGLISDVLARVRGGKEATVYRCEAHAASGFRLLAAKVYRPRMFRSLRNDAVYRQGREVLTAEGRPVGKQAGTIARAIRNRTEYGLQAQHTSWLMHEFTALEALYRAGAAVPRPVAASENALLMGYVGDEQVAAPALQTISLGRDQAEPTFREVVRNIELMLRYGWVHGDLSAYNILYWQGQITLIDFPQVVNVHSNPEAQGILQRDVRRTCEYFAQQGVRTDPAALGARLWGLYGERVDAREIAADWSRVEARVE
jgi:RIO kinase 1